MKRIIDKEALKYAAEKIIASGHVVNAQALANLAGVHKATISRNLRSLGIPFTETRNRYESSMDAEYRTHAEIARMIRAELEKENPHRPGRPITGKELVVRLGLKCSERMVRKIMRKYGIANSWERARKR